MFLKTMNIFLPILSLREKYGMELKDLKKREAKVEKLQRLLRQERLYLQDRIEGLNNTIELLLAEEQDEQIAQEPPDPDNIPIFPQPPTVNYRA